MLAVGIAVWQAQRYYPFHVWVFPLSDPEPPPSPWSWSWSRRCGRRQLVWARPHNGLARPIHRRVARAAGRRPGLGRGQFTLAVGATRTGPLPLDGVSRPIAGVPVAERAVKTGRWRSALVRGPPLTGRSEKTTQTRTVISGASQRCQAAIQHANDFGEQDSS
jgi:hypothetical protein